MERTNPPGASPARRPRLVEDWRQSWRWLSVQLAAAASLLGGALVGVLPNVLVYVAQLPTGKRLAAAVAVMVLTLVLPWLARVLKQGGTNAVAE